MRLQQAPHSDCGRAEALYQCQTRRSRGRRRTRHALVHQGQQTLVFRIEPARAYHGLGAADAHQMPIKGETGGGVQFLQAAAVQHEMPLRRQTQGPQRVRDGDEIRQPPDICQVKNARPLLDFMLYQACGGVHSVNNPGQSLRGHQKLISAHPAAAAERAPELALVRSRYVGEPGELLLPAVHRATVACGGAHDTNFP